MNKKRIIAEVATLGGIVMDRSMYEFDSGGYIINNIHHPVIVAISNARDRAQDELDLLGKKRRFFFQLFDLWHDVDAARELQGDIDMHNADFGKMHEAACKHCKLHDPKGRGKDICI